MTASKKKVRHAKEDPERIGQGTDEARLPNNEPLDWDELRDKVTELYLVLERINLTEYIAYLNNPRRLLWLNFGVGLVKGLGGAIGATLLLGLLVMFLRRLVLLNLPVIGGVIGEIVKLVNAHNGY
ncbi:hypothetical protein DesLBE_4602 [Desulfitobacterium sp. LBE]|uniref:Uncharacterized protein n=2 Tax=Desulfitobacterium hafniense TaxID=49338 RepID=A0A098B550_DESHA|nr:MULTISPECIES: DUF5665 domain-containing protein [Desulfitobacterium]ACL22035.1 hypothetical protein Dhaf_4025 [Desulfitobacterium hafniense DCB-2]TWH60183.1 hypothetical protein DesLBE_4602 [Desulfitobacterium sp. LBE]CDX02991.1 Hypothetical protein DPCES_3104 [Desulfitobacterium hafniense]